MRKITVPYKGAPLRLDAGEMVEFTGTIYCGRDAVLPYVVEYAKNHTIEKDYGVDLRGAVIFHTAVSCAGIAPTTSSKPEIMGSIVPLSEEGVLFHLGKGLISEEAVEGLQRNNAYFLVTPPVAALLTACMYECRAIIHPEFGMEAFYEIKVRDFPAVVAAADGKTILA